MKIVRRLAFGVLLALLPFAVLDATPPALGCGGPDYADLGALGPAGTTLTLLEWQDADFDPRLQKQFRFLYPFYQADPAKLTALWAFSYGYGSTVAKPSLAPLEKAIGAGQLPAAKRAAEHALAAWLALPPVPAADHTDVLWRAVELLELYPHLQNVPNAARRAVLLGEPLPAGQTLSPTLQSSVAARDAAHRPTGAVPAGHPRAPSAAFVAMQRDFRKQVPDGWGDAIRKQVPASLWGHFEQTADRWLANNPQHPLRDLVRLWKVRIYYFAGRFADAWQLLFRIHGTQPVRALAEMRYLLLHGKRPSQQQLQALQDPYLITALTDDASLSRQRWTQLWKLASTTPVKPWSVNLQERLLLWAAKKAGPGQLPAGFPTRAANPTVLWGKLRAVALLAAHRRKAAATQLASLPADYAQARLLAKLRLEQGHPALAAQTPALNDAARHYITRVLVPDKQLRLLAKGSPAKLRLEAQLERAVRLAAQGHWKRAARLAAKAAPKRAALWQQAAKLSKAKDPAGRLRWARFLKDQHGKLLYDADRGWYRSVSSRYRSSTLAASETKRIEQCLTRSSERWLALVAYTRWLIAHPNHPDARTVLSEADAVYNRLINWGGGNHFFWGRYAPSTKVVTKLRRAGKAIRARQP